ncbi:uncharacterized protein [Equus asinus]|uniref:uncharacterized protein n=1 Tax=Equus asinus TaxID=9793 RepID=UPI0038F651C8
MASVSFLPESGKSGSFCVPFLSTPLVKSERNHSQALLGNGGLAAWGRGLGGARAPTVGLGLREGRGGAARNREAGRLALTHGHLLTRVPRSSPPPPPPAPWASAQPQGFPPRRWAPFSLCFSAPPGAARQDRRAEGRHPHTTATCARGSACGQKGPRALTAAKRLPRSLLSCSRGFSEPAWRTLGGPSFGVVGSIKFHWLDTACSWTAAAERSRTPDKNRQEVRVLTTSVSRISAYRLQWKQEWTRVLIKQERRKQKEYFEKKRLKSKMKFREVLSPVKNSAVSLDLLNLYMVNQISCQKKRPETVRKPIHVNMNRDIKMPLRKHDLELPMSPHLVPSNLCIDDMENNLHYQRQGSKEELGPVKLSNVNYSNSVISKLNKNLDAFSPSYKTAQFGTLFERLNSPGNRNFLTERPDIVTGEDCGTMDERRQSDFIIEK